MGEVFDDDNLTLSKSSIAEAGDGLYALRDFEAGEVITTYTGQVVPYKEARMRRDSGEGSHLRSLITMYYAIDGNRDENGNYLTNKRTQLFGKGVAQMVNHADEEFANARFDFVDSDVNKRRIDEWLRGNYTMTPLPTERTVVLIAKRDIEAGEEIFVNYGSDYWENQSNLN